MINLWTRTSGNRDIRQVAEMSDIAASQSKIIALSGRLYMDRNLWRGWNNAYGPYYHQWSQSFGTGAQPNYSLTNVKGVTIASPGTLTKIKMTIDRNNAENAPFEIDISYIRAGVRTNIATITNTTYNTNNSYHTVTPGVSLLEDDVIMLSGRKVGGTTTRRYSYTTLTLEIV